MATGARVTQDEALRAAAARLAAAGVPEARLKAEWWLADRLGCPRLELTLRRAEPLPETVRIGMESDVRRLERHEPLEYVLGWMDFCGRRFVVNRNVLIPRPETEELAGRALGERDRWAAVADSGKPCAADIGTGSGCLAVTLAATADVRVLAVDASAAALSVARENAARHGVARRIHFHHGDLLSGGAARPRLSLVVANLPYIPTAEMAQLEPHVRDYEPPSALDGGADGLTLVRRLIPQAAVKLRPGGRLWLEMAEDQGARILACLREGPWREATVHDDLYGRPRFVSATLASQPTTNNQQLTTNNHSRP